MRKLQILISQYKETDNIIKPLLDSIAIQQGINLNEDIEILIGNDGSDIKLTSDFLKTYSYKIQYYFFTHGGLAETRKKLQSLSSADYIMFCDADDQFINIIALQIIFQYINKGCDILNYDFLEEYIISDNQTNYVLRQNDSVFVHGKIYRRQFLLDNQIEWDSTLREHQDSAFNTLAHILSKSTEYCHIPLYLWHDNRNSISRKNSKYHLLNTWPAMIDSYQSLINSLNNRGLSQLASQYAMSCLYATYYEMSHAVWKEDTMIQQKIDAYKRFNNFYNTNKPLLKMVTNEQINQIQQKREKLAKTKGQLTDMPPFEEWLNSVITIWRNA